MSWTKVDHTNTRCIICGNSETSEIYNKILELLNDKLYFSIIDIKKGLED